MREGEKKKQLCLECVGQWSSSWWSEEGFFSKSWRRKSLKLDPQTLQMELQSLQNPCTKKEIRRNGAAYKQNSSEQLVKPNKLLLETLLIDKQ